VSGNSTSGCVRPRSKAVRVRPSAKTRTRRRCRRQAVLCGVIGPRLTSAHGCQLDHRSHEVLRQAPSLMR
jgi:hypothetical protein